MIKLEDLPHEIIFHISNHLNQNELLNLLCTSSNLYNLLHPRLYSAINIDSSKKIFTDFKVDDLKYSVIPNYYDDGFIKVKPVTVSSLYSLNLLFKNLISHPRYCSYVRVLIFNKKIPDIPDLELYKILTILSGNLKHLKVFHWMNDQYNLSNKFISDLTLIELKGNLTVDKGTSLSFPYLKSLELSNYNLQPVNFTNLPNLKELTISKLPNSNDRRNLNSNHWENKDLKSNVSAIFNPENQLSTKLNLTKLTLKDLVISGDDVQALHKHIDLSKLTSLSMINCFESIYDQDEMYEVRRRRIKTKFFLNELSLKVNKQLEHLDIYMINELNYNNKLIKFLGDFKHLKSLKLSININEFENLNSNLISIFKSISNEIERFEFNYNLIGNENHIKTMNHLNCDSKMLLILNKFPKLKYLNIPFHYDGSESIYDRLTTNLQIISLRIHQDSITKKLSPKCNCLINSGYFANTSLIADQFQPDDECIVKYKATVNKLRKNVKSLKWIQLEFNDDSIIFQCLNDNNDKNENKNNNNNNKINEYGMVHREGLQNYFHKIIENQIV
ncbi:hypothetical protein DFJ63DRAFT_314128 [Scheffersomyces coipomensis]|uniref:uncharacterized protein n=1 Tax=Scheffersomyces coipomensis TaxID=1788519 RepID=UPI00315CC0FC